MEMAVLNNFQFNEPAPSRGSAALMKGNPLAFWVFLSSFCFDVKMAGPKFIQFWWLRASWAVKGVLGVPTCLHSFPQKERETKQFSYLTAYLINDSKYQPYRLTESGRKLKEHLGEEANRKGSNHSSSSISIPVEQHFPSQRFLQWRKCYRNSAQGATKIYLYTEVSQLILLLVSSHEAVRQLWTKLNQLSSFYQYGLSSPWLL